MPRRRRTGGGQGSPRQQPAAPAGGASPTSGVKRALQGLRGVEGELTPRPGPRPPRSAGKAKPVERRSAPQRTVRSAPARRPAPATARAASDGDRPQSALGWLLGRGASRSRGARGTGNVEQPPVASSLARGLGVVGGSPTILLLAFGFLLALWLVFSTYGVVLAASPAAMVLLEALPPVHSFIDLEFLVAGRTVAPLVALGFGAALVVLRSIAGALWIGAMLERFGESPERPGTLRGMLARARRGFVSVLGLEAAFLGLALVAVILATGFLGSLGQLALIGALIGGLYFLSFAEIAAMAEGVGPRQALRLSMAASRIPGPRHMLLVVVYITLTLFVSVVTPGSRVAAATPSLGVWLFVLFVSFLHLSVLGAFVYRWLLLRLHAQASLEARQRAAEKARNSRARGVLRGR